jgi:hypothetical protein
MTPDIPHYAPLDKTDTQHRAETCPACKRPKELKVDKPAKDPGHVRIRPMQVKPNRQRRRRKDRRFVTFY